MITKGRSSRKYVTRKNVFRTKKYFTGRFYSSGDICDCSVCRSEQQNRNVRSDEEEQEKMSDYHEGGYLALHLGDVLNNRYQVIRKLGWGVFSTVWLCWDRVEKEFVAMKIVKDLECDRIIALGEIALLEQIHSTGKKGEPGKSRIVHLLDSFCVEGENGTHVCMVFEVLGKNLLSLLNRDEHKRAQLNKVKTIVRQLLEALSFLHDMCRVVHTDIKPENVFLRVDKNYVWGLALEVLESACSGEPLGPSKVCAVDAVRQTSRGRHKLSSSTMFKLKKLKRELERTMEEEMPGSGGDVGSGASEGFRSSESGRRRSAVGIKLGDLGNAVPLGYDYKCKIQTEPYRAPEVILRAGFDCGADIWSVGCLAFELATGHILFEPTKSHWVSRAENHLACIMQVAGRIPFGLRSKAGYASRYFTKYGTLKRVGRVRKIGLKNILVGDCGFDERRAAGFAGFLESLLTIDPSKRPTALQSLKHPWLKGNRDCDRLYEVS